ncbi:MAG: VaFE repeat-containing surface-anchored protein [Saccharofermentans sp.]|nr:VaFE repeat-containing surface-anchored protein [Saccharofermentans sp.]
MKTRIIKKIVSLGVALGVIFGFSFAGIELFLTSSKYYKEHDSHVKFDAFGDVKEIKVSANTNDSLSIEDYLYSNRNVDLIPVCSKEMEQVDAIRVKQIFVDKSSLDFEVNSSSDYWANTRDYAGYLKMNESVQILYDPGKDSDYFLSLVNPMDNINSSVEFTKSNMQGESIDNCIYDSDTGIAYIRKNAISDEGLASIQAEVFYMCDNASPSNNVGVSVTNKNISDGLISNGIASLDAADDVVKIHIASKKAQMELATDYLGVKINDHEVSSNYYWYNKDDGSLVIKYPASSIYSVSIEAQKPGVYKRVLNYLYHMWDAPTVNADSFDDMNVASGAWSASGGVPGAGTTFVVDGVSVQYGNYTADGKTYIPRTENKLTDADLANMASVIAGGSGGDLNAQYYASGNFQVYKVNIPDKTLVKDGITYHIPASTFVLHCSHSTVNAISGNPNMDPGKVIVNIMGISNGFALVGMFTEFPGYAQEGVGYFRVPFETDTTAHAKVNIHKSYLGNGYPKAIFAIVPESQAGIDNYGITAMNNVKAFVRHVYRYAGVSDVAAMSNWEADIFCCRGSKPATSSVIRTMFYQLFSNRMHYDGLEDGTSVLRFNSPDDANYVIGILICALNDTYEYGSAQNWVYTETFPENTELDVYRAIDEVLCAPVYNKSDTIDAIGRFYVSPDITLMVTDGNGNASADLFLGNISSGNSSITAKFMYREVFGGRDQGKIDSDTYTLELTYNQVSGGTSITYGIYAGNGAIIYSKIGDSITLVNTMGVGSDSFVNAKDDVVYPASISLVKTGGVFSGVNVERKTINGKTYVINSPYQTNVPVNGAIYCITSGATVYPMVRNGNNFTYGNLTSEEGKTTVYKIFEKVAPSGYSVSSAYWEVSVIRTHTVEGDTNVYRDSISSIKYYGPDNKNYDVAVNSEPLVAVDELQTASITVNKTFDKVIASDSVNYEEELKKCVFGLYAKEKITLTNGTTIAPGTLVSVATISSWDGSESDIKGYASFEGIPNGKYYVAELDGSSLFALDKSQKEVNANGGKYTVSFTNRTGSINVVKTKPSGDRFMLDTVKFELYKDGVKLIATGTTNAKGEVSWDNDVSSLLLGSYVIKESFTPVTYECTDGTILNYEIQNNSNWKKESDTSYSYAFELKDDIGSEITFSVENDLQDTEFFLRKVIISEGDEADIRFDLISNDVLVAQGSCHTEGDTTKEYDVVWDFDGSKNSHIMIPTGVYELREYIEESSFCGVDYTYLCPDGFEISSDGTYFYKYMYITDNEGVTSEVVTNTRKTADLEIMKDSETGEIENVMFRLCYRGNDEEPCAKEERVLIRPSEDQTVFMTNEEGNIRITNLPQGWYEIIEIVPDGNKVIWEGDLSEEGNRLVNLSGEDAYVTTMVTARNEINVSVVVDKKDLWTLKAVGGASFTLYSDVNRNGIVDDEEEETRVLAYDEDKDGVVEFNNLPSGQYIIREYATVNGYYINYTDFVVVINSRDNSYVEVDEEPYSVPILIYKKDFDDDNHYLSGAVFTLYEDVNRNGLYEEDIDVKAVTYGDERGVTKEASFYEITKDGNKVYISDYVKPGYYLIYEEVTPYGYDHVNSKFTSVVIDSVDTDTDGFKVFPHEVTIKNICRGSVHITKVDEEYPDMKLSGAEFSVYKDVNKNMIIDEKDVLVGTMKEESIGEYYAYDLPYGDYLIEETMSPAGYVKRDDTWNVSIKENGEVYDILDSDFEGISNKFSGRVSIYKTESENVGTGKYVSGAVFSVYTDDNEYVGILNEDVDGVYRLSGLKRGNYYVIEEVAPEGFIRDEGVYSFEISNDAYDVVVDNADTYGVEGYFIEDIPSIGTTLTNDKTKSHIVPRNSVVTLTDEVSYSGLIPGKEYVMTGTLVNKTNGKRVTGVSDVDITFVPATSSGVVKVPFTLQTSRIDGNAVVAYEKLYLDGNLVVDHSDINNSSQTVSFNKVDVPSTGEASIYYYTLIGAMTVLGSAVLAGYVSLVKGSKSKDDERE